MRALAAMRAAVAAHRASAGDVQAAFGANRDFHLALVAGAGNAFLRRFVEGLWARRVGLRIYEAQRESRTSSRSTPTSTRRSPTRWRGAPPTRPSCGCASTSRSPCGSSSRRSATTPPHERAPQAPDLLVHEREPLNLETPRAVLGAASLTPADAFFVRDHGPVPDAGPDWRLEVGGLVDAPLSLGLDELRDGRFARQEVTATLQCAGNRRAALLAVADIPGEAPWGPGATGTAVWGGVALADVLRAAGPQAPAGHVAAVGADRAPEARPPQPFGASVPLRKALGDEVLLAWEMNGAPLPAAHGAPLRLVVPGWIGARSVKWLRRIVLRDRPFDGWFQDVAYRLLAPGQEPGPGVGIALGEVALNADVLVPADGATVGPGPFEVRGYAHAGGDRTVARVDVSADGGRRGGRPSCSRTSAGGPGAGGGPSSRSPGDARARRARLGQRGGDAAREPGRRVEPEGLRQQRLGTDHRAGGGMSDDEPRGDVGGGGPYDPRRPLDPRDYSRRTLLANERTFLAWWRTGLAALTVGLAGARIIPIVGQVRAQWPYTTIGVLFAALGVVPRLRRAAPARGSTRRRGAATTPSPTAGCWCCSPCWPRWPGSASSRSSSSTPTATDESVPASPSEGAWACAQPSGRDRKAGRRTAGPGVRPPPRGAARRTLMLRLPGLRDLGREISTARRLRPYLRTWPGLHDQRCPSRVPTSAGAGARPVAVGFFR